MSIQPFGGSRGGALGAMLWMHSGAARVFVTLRDNLAGAWASEGLLGGPPCTPRYKPAAWAVAGVARLAG